jgi:DNA-binding IclR family transcriptional regulator
LYNWQPQSGPDRSATTEGSAVLVKQISNLFSLMDLFVRAGRPLSVREIVDEFSWPRSSVFNIVATLMELGYLYQPVPRGGYYPTSKWMDLARELGEAQPLPESVHRLLEQLMEQTGETVLLAAPEAVNAVVLDVAESRADIRYTAQIGQRIPIHVTAAGHAILAQYSAQERAALLGRIQFQRYARPAFMNAEAVEREVENAAKKGWHVNLGNYANDLAGVAVPFPFRDRRYSIVLGAPVSRVEHRAGALGKQLRQAVSRFLQIEARTQPARSPR